MKPLVIANFIQGVAESSIVGFGNMQNCSVDEITGAVTVTGLPEEQSSAVVGSSNIPYWIRQDPNTGNFFCLLSNGTILKQLWATTTWTDISHVDATTAASGNGLAIWKGYLIVARNILFDAYKLTTDTWTTTSWTPLTGGVGPSNDTTQFWHPMVVGQDDILYIGHTKYVASIREVSGSTFSPASAGTYTGTLAALDLPNGHFVRSIAELGKNLMIGTVQSNRVEGGYIFPWDRLSQTFSLPIRTEELGIRSMLSHNGMLYFIAGLRGQLYVTDGSRAVKLRRIPTQLLGISGGKWCDVYPDAMTWHKNKLFFGISVNNTNADDGYGVWSYDNGKLLMEYSTSNGATGSAGVTIGTINAFTEDQIKIGWKNQTASDAGIDNVSNSKRRGSYGAFIESKFYDVAYKFERKTFRILEVRLAKALATGEGVRIKYREKMGDSFTTLATFTDTVHIHRTDIGLDVASIQLRIELTTDGAGGNSNGSPQLTSVILR